MARKGQMSRNGQDPIFGGDISPMNSNEEPLGTPDPQPQTINLVSSSLPSPLATRKRKSSDSPEYDQDHRVPTKRFSEDGYPNTSMAIRLLVVFNYLTFTNPVNEERKSSECDVQSLDTTFSELGYKIALNENLSYEETFNHLKKIQELCNGGGIHTIVLAFMSHGDGRDPDHFLTRDGKSVSMSQVRKLFSNKNCEGLWGKPKIFLGIFCRNKANHEDVLQSSPAIEPERSQSDPHSLENNDAEYDLEIEEAVQLVTRFMNDDLGDMTTIYASKPRTASYRDPRRGTIMVQCLCRVLDKHGQTHPLNDLYRFLQQDMEAKQTGASSEYSFSPDRDDLGDMTTIYASKPGTASYRDPRRGTVFVQCLCRVLDKYGQTHPLNDLYRFLQQEMESEQTGASSEYRFSPDRDDLELKTFFFADIILYRKRLLARINESLQKGEHMV